MADRETLAKYLRKVTGELRGAQRRVLELEGRGHEPIAIVGMSCRFPGGAEGPNALWEMLTAGDEGIGTFPADRGWDLDRLYDPDPESAGSTHVRHGGFLDRVAGFDAEFFDIAPREALAMDPQQRLLLESCWEALEDGGIDPGALREQPTGVFAGVIHHDYASGGGGPVELEGYRLTGTAGSVASGRVAYALGLEGPAITIDTACSSSLVAMHLAAQALRGGECSLALAGGATVLASPEVFIEFSRQRGLAPDGRCKAFAEAADGVGWSEGVGMLVLERLSDAEANGHNILATIKGSAVNQDGASNGLTAPNGPSQERVIRQALADACLEPKDVDVVEAHGTGTTLGDPIEAGALLSTYGQGREEPLKLGSIKSNIGHAQAAAGVAGVIKTVLAMREGVLPKTLHVDAPSAKVEWGEGKIELLTEAQEWQANGRPRRAGVSSFGISGTNAHLILEEGPRSEDEGDDEEGRSLPGPLPLVFSAKSEDALREQAARLATHIRANPELDPTDLAFSLATTRAQLERRAAVVGKGAVELLAGLDALARAEAPPNATTAEASEGQLAYLFTGQGSQRAGMGKELYETYPAYAGALDRACEEIDEHLDRPLKDLLFAKEGSKKAALLDDTTYAQPALFATGLALYRLLESFGLRPDFLTGHSVGEITAAHIAGVFSLKDAAKLICARGALMGALPKGGAMLAVQATEQEALAAIEGKEELLSLAAINAPEAVVVSGERAAIEALDTHWQGEGKKTKRLTVSHAFHSPLIEPMLAPFAEILSTLELNPPKLTVISNLSGEELTPEQATDPAYWVIHARSPVRFADSVSNLKEQGAATFVELGPDPVLTAMARKTLGEQEREVLVPTLRQGRGEPTAIVLAFAAAWTAGARPDWDVYFETAQARAVPLPTYPFQRQRYWVSSSSGGVDPAAIGQSDADHPLLKSVIEDPRGEGLILTGSISLSTQPWLADHAVSGTVLLPGTAFLELAFEAAARGGCEEVKELTLQAPLSLPEEGTVALQVRLGSAGEDGEREVSIHSRRQAEGQEGEWVTHAEGLLSAEASEPPGSLAVWPPAGAEPIALDGLYERLAAAGFEYGPAFQGLSAAWRDGEELYVEASLAPEQASEAAGFGVHPALLDATGHAVLDAGLAEAVEADALNLPFSWRGARLAARGSSLLRCRLGRDGDRVSTVAFTATGEPAASIESLVMRPIERSELGAAARGSLYGVEWVELDRPAGGEVPAHALVELGADSGGTVESARANLHEALERAHVWLADEDKSDSRLVFLTEWALAAADDEGRLDLAAAPLAGFIRSVHSEHPEHFAQIDSDGSAASLEALDAALVLCAEEPQLALRGGRLLAPRLVPVAPVPQSGGGEIDPEATVLITGGTGALGALVARHLAAEHGVRHLLLLGRRGPMADGAAVLEQELRELGAEVTIAARDVSRREELERAIAAIPAEHPLGAVFHCAGVLEDAVITSLDGEGIDRVLAPKLDAAWHLHELSEGLELSHFVMFSSAAGLLGGAAQANYAAANAFLDALAQKRRAADLPGQSLAWGIWKQGSGMTASLSAADLNRQWEQARARLGIVPHEPRAGLGLLDVALASGVPLLAPVELDRGVLRARAKSDSLQPLLRGLVRTPARPRAASGSLAARLDGVEEAEREQVVLDLVRGHVAAVLGHGSPAAIPSQRPFKELGFDSLAAVELRNRLSDEAGVRLPSTLAFDHPSTAALAAFLLEQAGEAGRRAAVAPRAAASTEEPIAVVGIGCHFPGGVDSPRELWEMLAAGDEAIGDFPDDRGWDVDRLFDPDPDRAGASSTRRGSFLEDPAGFDAGFFGIGPREALAVDPQQRLMLETCWEALEDAGLDPLALRGSQTGVFTGVMYHDYGIPSGAEAELEGYMMKVSTGSAVSGRAAYTFGFEGPTMSVDTACSSSLVALHLAAQALRQGECSLALAGGVTVLATPNIFIEFSRQRGVAPDGRCKAFSEAADGTGFSEGAGMLVLERLSDAHAAGHHVLATIRGSAVNQDGASNGLTAPNGPSQERVIQQALANAGLAPGDIDAVEAHGTGTALGDPIEAGALLATYGQEKREQPLWLGSIKSNIGHAQGAAGVAGVIKMVLAMREGLLPRTLHAERPSSRIEWGSGHVELLNESTSWRANGRPRRAGVSSFGATGTNAHLIVEEAPEVPVRSGPVGVADDDEGTSPSELLLGPAPLLISAKSKPALRQAAKRLAAHLRAHPHLDPDAVARSLATTRARLELGTAVVGEERAELLAGLDALAAGDEATGVAIGKATGAARPVFLFPGQGAQFPGMALELLDSSPFFAARIEECEQALAPFVEWSLTEVLADEAGSWLDRLDIVQPALFAVMVSLARLWQALGVKPVAVVGHSQGEIAAAHIAGGLSLSDAARVVALRAQAMAKIAGKGAMASVSVSADDLVPLLEPFGERISLAAVNGPASLVLSGQPDALDELLTQCQRDDIRAKRIAVDYAAHSAQIEALRDELLEAFAPIEPRSGEIPLHSTVSGERIDTAGLDAEYWYRNLRETVRLEPVLRSLIERGYGTLIEVGPHPVLSFAVEETIAASGEQERAVALSTLRRGEGDRGRFALSVAEAHLAGVEVDWGAFFSTVEDPPVALPTYPFQRQRYWIDSVASGPGADAIGLVPRDHPLLGAVIDDPRGEGLILSGRISRRAHPWLVDHAAAGTVLLPGAAFVEMALSAAATAACDLLEELTLRAPLIVPEEGGVQLRVLVAAPSPEGERELSIHSRPEVDLPGGEAAEWTCHAEGVLRTGGAVTAESLNAWPPPGAEPLPLDSLYERLVDLGFEYGPAFQGLRAAWRVGDEIYAEVSLAAEQTGEAKRFGVHPALLDAALHAGIETTMSSGERGPEKAGWPLLPFAWHGVRIGRGGAASLRVKIGLEPERNATTVSAVDESGEPVLSVEQMVGREVDPRQLREVASARSTYRVEWQPVDLDAGTTEPPPTELLTVSQLDLDPDPEPIAGAHAAALRALATVQRWLAGERPEDERLVLLTEGALAAGEGEKPDLAIAPLWGLIRSAASEHPGRFAAIDTDGSEASTEVLDSALALAAEEPQLVLREGRALAPRLLPARARADREPARPLDPERTVLITGGVSGIGAQIARHLATEHGARHLLLLSRRGIDSPGAPALVAELEGLGAIVAVRACDVTDREQLREALESIDPAHPLGAVVHSAGMLDDTVIESIDPEQLTRVLTPKVDAGWHLHELTADLDLDQFLLFSSTAGLLGGAAQANYAAANAFLDALAQHRQAAGLPASALAWGLWEQGSGAMVNEIAAEDLARVAEQIRARIGFAPMSTEAGLELFDAARALGDPLLATAQFDRAALRAQARAGTLPALLRGLVPSATVDERERESLSARIAGLGEAERQALALDLVRTHAARVLGHSSAARIEPNQPFKELGFDSLAAVELRNRLGAAAGLRLPPTAVFDYPSARLLAAYLVEEAGGERTAATAPSSEGELATETPVERELIEQIDSMDIDELVEQTLEQSAAAGEAGGGE